MGRRPGRRTALTALAASFACVPFVLTACGDPAEEGSALTLPAINTTTSTTIPVTTTTEYIPITHEIAPGENLRTIAELYLVDYDELIRTNDILDPDYIQAGDVLTIPAPTTTTTTSTTTTTTTLPPTTTTEG